MLKAGECLLTRRHFLRITLREGVEKNIKSVLSMRNKCLCKSNSLVCQNFYIWVINSKVPEMQAVSALYYAGDVVKCNKKQAFRFL